jgi:hypothetical protein
MNCNLNDLLPLEENDSELSKIAAWLSGNFDCLKQVEAEKQLALEKNQPPVKRARVFMHISPTHVEELSEYGYCFYLEQAVEGYEDAPYRQRLYLLARDKEGRALNRIFDIEDSAALIGAWKAPELLADLKAERLKQACGCDVFWTRIGEDCFTGEAGAGGTCRTSYGGATHITVKIELTADLLKTLDQGFDDKGTLIFGPSAAEGAYEFRRQT